MRHRQVVTLSLLLKLLNATIDVRAHESDNGLAPVRVGEMEVYRKGELTAGECGILFSKASTPGATEQSQQRQLCFALQGFGFLTRYSRRDHQESQGWGDNVCLLLAFCGTDCHRLYGHPQNTPAAVKALTDAARFAANSTEFSEQSSNTELSAFEKKAPSSTEAEPAAESLSSKVHARRHIKTSEAGLVTSAKELEVEAFRTAKASLSYVEERNRNCSRPFMSISFPRNCRSVYTIDFEAQHQGFGKFLARVALLIGAADIEEVAAIERQIQKYILAKDTRALRSSSGPAHEQKNVEHSSQSIANPKAPHSGTPKNAVLIRAAELSNSRPLPAEKLEIILKPLFPDASSLSGLQKSVYDLPAPSIQISIPSSFTAHIAREAAAENSLPRTRRLRGNDFKGPRNAARPPLRRPLPAGVEMVSFAHCKAAAAFMSERPKLQWLQQHVFFLQRRE